MTIFTANGRPIPSRQTFGAIVTNLVDEVVALRDGQPIENLPIAVRGKTV